MGKRIIPRRRGRGHRFKAADNRFKGEARHPRSKSSSGKVLELMHDPGRTAPIAKVEGQDGTYTMIAHNGMHVGQDVATGHGAEIDVGNSVFEYGQTYVALSRVQSLEGLYLSAFEPDKIEINPNVAAFYRNIPDIINKPPILDKEPDDPNVKRIKL